MARTSTWWQQLRSFIFGGGGGNAWLGVSANDYIPARRQQFADGGVPVTTDGAMRHSAVWACLRLRADLISTMPIDVFRMVNGIQIEMPTPPVLVGHSGGRMDICEWMYSTQVDLDRAGNVFGLITERNAAGLPSRIDLQPLAVCSVRDRDGVLTYRIDNKEYPPEQVWHERQYTIAGLPVGLSPVAYGAWSIGGYLSAQHFGLDFFKNPHPGGVLINTELSTITDESAAAMKARFKVAVESRAPFVTGKGWEWTPAIAEAAALAFLDERKFSIGDVARFFGCPGDLIDAMVSSPSITYANITQRNLQFLIMNLGPAIVRRERKLSSLLPAPRYVKLNADSLLRMDPETRSKVINGQVMARVLAPSEARALENRPPFTPDQIAEFDLLAVPLAGAKKGAEVV